MKKRTNVTKPLYSILGLLFLTLGLILIFNSLSGITGYAISEDVNAPMEGVAGLFFITIGIFLLKKARREKRAQAAMEFLMTYGWAILAAIIVIGILVYLGFFKPGETFSNIVILSPPFYGEGVNIIQSGSGCLDGVLNLGLINKAGEDYTIQRIDVPGCGIMNTITPINNGERKEFSILCDPGSALTQGKRFKADVTVVYRKKGSNLDLTSSGAISDKVLGGTCNIVLPLGDCGTLDQPGITYALTEDVFGAGTTCFTIAADNITLDGKGFNVNGNDLSNTYGVIADGRLNVTIKNLNLTDFGRGVSFSETNNSLIENITTNSNSYGIILFSSSNNNLNNNIANSNGVRGISLFSGSNNNLNNNTVNSNKYGIILFSGSNNNLNNNTVNSNNFDGIAITVDSINNILDSNTACSNRVNDFLCLTAPSSFNGNTCDSSTCGACATACSLSSAVGKISKVSKSSRSIYHWKIIKVN